MRLTPHFPRTLCNVAQRHTSAFALALLAISVMLAPPASGKSEEVVRAPSGVMYVTGGVSSEAVDLLKSMEKDFNLKLVFANASGAFLSDVKVTIADASGHVVLDVTSEGPLLMAKLAAGSYRVDANFNGHPESHQITVAANKLVTVDFRWPANW
jgi:hypothetical protein